MDPIFYSPYQWVDMRVSGREDNTLIPVFNPADGTLVGTVPGNTPSDLNEAVEASLTAFPSWSRRDMVDRGKVLFTAARMVRDQQDHLATLLTREQGKPLKESANEIAGFARVLEYYASVSGSLRGEYSYSRLYGHSIVSRRPLGVCGAIIPWNMPVLIMGWKICPALVTGNTMVLKPATTAPLTCIALAGILVTAGIPEGVLSILTGPGEVIGEAMAAHPDIRALSFTGEISTGIRVSTRAAPTMKRLILELGGSDAMIVCRDADIGAAASGAVSGRFFNCGQTCTAVKRLFVDDIIADEFISRVKERISAMKVGNGLALGTDMGPMHTASHRDRLLDQVERTVSSGRGRIILGEAVPDRTSPDGSFLNPILITDVSPDAPVVTEEVFGPVLPVIRYYKLDDAIQMANHTRYGLGASVWTEDLKTITRTSEELTSGIVWINQHLKIPPEVPFGGMKESGHGRENGIRALDHYLEDKTILIRST